MLLVPTVQQSDSATHIYICSFFQIFFSIMVYHRVFFNRRIIAYNEVVLSAVQERESVRFLKNYSH